MLFYIHMWHTGGRWGVVKWKRQRQASKQAQSQSIIKTTLHLNNNILSWFYSFSSLHLCASLSSSSSSFSSAFRSPGVLITSQRVGCDLRIGSTKKIDSCGVCVDFFMFSFATKFSMLVLSLSLSLFPFRFVAVMPPLVLSHFIIGKLLACQFVQWLAEEVIMGQPWMDWGNKKKLFQLRKHFNHERAKINSSHSLEFPSSFPFFVYWRL